MIDILADNYLGRGIHYLPVGHYFQEELHTFMLRNSVNMIITSYDYLSRVCEGHEHGNKETGETACQWRVVY